MKIKDNKKALVFIVAFFAVSTYWFLSKFEILLYNEIAEINERRKANEY